MGGMGSSYGSSYGLGGYPGMTGMGGGYGMGMPGAGGMGMGSGYGSPFSSGGMYGGGMSGLGGSALGVGLGTSLFFKKLVSPRNKFTFNDSIEIWASETVKDNFGLIFGVILVQEVVEVFE
uniref:Peroxin-13 n=1 Tax=Angiostrongylus cantonensis TaxID=6313 RepID=A0A158P5T7_ANGCA